MIQNQYYSILTEQLSRQMDEETETIELAAKYCSHSIQKKRVIHIFGCGHSQMFAMEGFYRAGGLVPVNALLLPHLAVFPKAKLTTLEERVEGFANKYLDLENTSPDDTMIIVSVSGRNACVIDMAIEAKKLGMKVVAITSKEFSSSVTSRHSSGKKLMDLADDVIDLKCVKGDACLSLPQIPEKFTGTSTVLGMVVINAIMARTIELSLENGFIPPVYVSSNLDEGDAINDKYIKEYHNLIDCL